MPGLVRAGLRLTVTTVLGVAVLVLAAGPAGAHVEATVDPGARAGDGPVTVRFDAEAESATAGIAGVATQLPAGVLPEWVSLASGPPGWALTPTRDGYQVAGPALPTGTNAEYAVRIGQLPPDATTLVFKTLVRYSDGSEDAWIEEATPNNPDPASPAPSVTVAPAAGTPSAPASDSAASSSAAPTSAPASDAAGDPSSRGSAVPALVSIAVLLLAVAAAGLWYRRSRAGRSG